MEWDGKDTGEERRDALVIGSRSWENGDVLLNGLVLGPYSS